MMPISEVRHADLHARIVEVLHDFGLHTWMSREEAANAILELIEGQP